MGKEEVRGMTREELRDYVDEQRSLDNIPYHVYSTLIDGIDTLEQEPTTKNNPIDYYRAFKIACDLLSGAMLYGVDADKIFEIMMDKDGVVASDSYESYILNNLQELDRGQYASKPTTMKDCNTCTHNNETDGSNCYECVKDMCNNYESTTKNDLGVDNQNIRLIDANALIKRLLPKHFDWWGEDEQEQDDFSKGNNSMLEEVIEAIEEFPSVTPQEPCDKCEVGNPCLYCKHEFEPQESEVEG